MKLAIMQPYFLPYIGYFQLIHSVDRFVYYDDVSYIKQGWINRNRILLNKKEFLFTLEVKGAGSFKKINEVTVGTNRLKLLKTFLQAYSRAPFLKDIEPLLSRIFNQDETNLSRFIFSSNQIVIEYLGITTPIVLSSEITKNNELKGQDKVIDICNKLRATTYINSIGGKGLYSKEAFSSAGIDLKFLQDNAKPYNQTENGFIPGLSIMDVLLNNSQTEIREMLNQYELT